MFEVEQKFAVEGFAAIQRKLRERGVELSSPMSQADRYFAHPARDFAVTDEALRIRQIGDENRITYKGPKLDKLTKTRREIELPFDSGNDQAERYGELLMALGFSPRAVVSKQRRVGHFEHRGFAVEVALDDVDNVGTFVELEISAEDDALDAARAALLNLADELGLTQVERRSYLEMLLARG